MEGVIFVTMPVLALAIVAGSYLGRYEAKRVIKRGLPRFAIVFRNAMALLFVGFFAVVLFGSVIGEEGMLILGVGDGRTLESRIITTPENLQRMLFGFCGLLVCAAYHFSYARGSEIMRKRLVISYLEE